MRCLIIDDHALFREGLALTVKEGFPDTNVTQAATIGEAIQACHFSPGNLDVILSDLLYPGYEPFAQLQALLANANGVPVIVVSALESPFYVDQALRLGAHGYLYKSNTKEKMVDAIKRVTDGGYYRPSGGVPALERVNGRDSDWDGGVEWCGVTIPNRNCVKTLTPRQHDVLKHLVTGLSNKEIARKLGLLEGTVKIHLKAILQKLGAQNRTQAVVIAVKLLDAEKESGKNLFNKGMH